MEQKKVKIVDAAGMVVGDVAGASGKAWIDLEDLGVKSLNDGFMEDGFDMGTISKGVNVTVFYEGTLDLENIIEIKTSKDVLVYKKR